jgi:hypothetical protein
MLRWDQYGLHKRRAGTRYAKHLFLHPVGSAGHVVFSSAYGTRSIDKLVIMLSWDRYGFDKNRVGTSHVVHSGASRAQNVDPLFFMLGWDQYGLIKSASRHVTPKFCFFIRWDMRVKLCIPLHLGHETSMHYFSCSGGQVWNAQKVRRNTLLQTCVFAFGGISGSRSAFWCDQSPKP